VRVHDVRSEAPRRADCVARELEVSSPSSGAAIDDSALDVMATRNELALEVRYEDPEVRIVRAGVHL
jgi:hypothetical protein